MLFKALKCTKSPGYQGFAPGSTGGSYSTSPDPLVGGEGNILCQEPHPSRSFGPQSLALWASGFGSAGLTPRNGEVESWEPYMAVGSDNLFSTTLL